MDILEKLNELNKEITVSKGGGLFSKKSVIDIEKCTALIEDIKWQADVLLRQLSNVETAVNGSHHDDIDAILANINREIGRSGKDPTSKDKFKEAEEILVSSKVKAKQFLDASHKEANAILANAKREAEFIIHEARKSADGLLHDAQEVAVSVLDKATNGERPKDEDRNNVSFTKETIKFCSNLQRDTLHMIESAIAELEATLKSAKSQLKSNLTLADI